ncbi:F-box only protein 21 isoform X2 [Calliopsis andreniformis]|uniref:F-box only protein 21 isoform X2 n=1 Tax=Calliopsis andreniformis TaxID=337506 RepID=UPI003FCE1039
MASDTVVSLPEEVIVYILEDSRLGFWDVNNFGSTCKHLYKIVRDSNKLWRTKLYQRWPRLKEAYQRINESDSYMLNWKEEVKASINSRRKLLYHLTLMSRKHFEKEELSNSEFKEFDPLFRPEEGAHPLAYYFLVDELISLIERPAIVSNLTHRYYAVKIVRYLKQCHLRNEWQKFISLPQEKQTLEYGATIVAQWSQPERHILYSYISSLLDSIADQTKELLREYYPRHSIFSTPEDKFIFWKNNIIDDNQWSVLETRQITDTLCKVLFERLGFYGNSEMYYSSENSFIDQVLEQKSGNPITLAIIFESVARRLGIRCEPMSFPSHFLLRWKETYGPESEDGENFYIDVFNGGQFLTKTNCLRIAGLPKCQIEMYDNYKPATAVEAVTKLANNLEVAARQHTHLDSRCTRVLSALQLQLMIQPNDINTVSRLGRLYRKLHMNLIDLVKVLENMEKDLDDVLRRQANLLSRTFQLRLQISILEKEIKPQMRRIPSVKYAIGLIMIHRLHGYLCVITGWQLCSALSQNGDDDLEENLDQPFYYVFENNGSFHQVIQDLLLAPNPKWINNYTIGRYFYAFTGTHYVPNEEAASQYPEDEAVRNELINQAFPNRSTK